MTTQDILKECTVENTVVKLPDIQLDRKQYLEVKQKLELIGGKWKGGKVSGFVFQTDPTDLLQSVQAGDKRNIKKEYQFFATPDSLADELVSHSECLIQYRQRILEPSAGQGSIVKAINRCLPSARIDCFELMDVNQIMLKQIPTVNFLGDDFFKRDKSLKWDCIIANPPFSKNQDIDHIREMYECLDDGGRMVTVSSNHWRRSTFKKEMAFAAWLETIGAVVHDIEADTFKESGTSVSANFIIIDK